MKNPVIDVTDFLKLLHKNRNLFVQQKVGVLTPEEIKAKTMAATLGKSGEGLVSFKEVMDSIKKESFINGQVSVIDHLIFILENQLKSEG